MKTVVADPWNTQHPCDGESVTHFEDSFVIDEDNPTKLADSQQYLDRLCKFIIFFFTPIINNLISNYFILCL